MRASRPSLEGHIVRDGVRIAFEVFGEGERTVLLLPTWSIIHSRHWKAQVPYLARHAKVITFDGRGSGGSDRPTAPAAYSDREFALDALAVLDAANAAEAMVVSFSAGAGPALLLAAEHPERVCGAVFIAPSLGIAPGHPERAVSFNDPLPDDAGWNKFNRHYWLRAYPEYLEFFFSQVFSEPHSTKQREDCVGWGLETTPEVLIATVEAPEFEPGEIAALCAKVSCPVVVVHGDDDRISPWARGAALAEATRGRLVTLEGGGHGVHARDPVKVNLLLREALDPPPPLRTSWRRAKTRPKRALFISSPIGLGHAQRDIAIADALRIRHPDLQIDWLAQHPVTAVLQARGERIHPASWLLANESAHIESESSEHDLHCFQAWRRMDEILIANFMVFHDVIRESDYDLWIGDEAWELDYYLHENPEQKRAAYVWLTDFVGWLPMPEGGGREAHLTADYNAEMIEHIARFPRLRDRALFVGSPNDIVPDAFGPDLPKIRDWTEQNYQFTGYVTGFDPKDFVDREALRHELGYRHDEKVCIATVGGSGVGSHLLKRIIQAFPEAKRQMPELRMIVVAGPRIDPSMFTPADGLEVRPYVDQLYRHLGACDLALVQGGLTTTMELTANRRPFIYFPLKNHFEQNFHVHHRLCQYDAGHRMHYGDATPEVLAASMTALVKQPVSSRPVESDGAERAAALIADML